MGCDTFGIDVAIGDFNWYVVMLILIWDDVVNGDHVSMNWIELWWTILNCICNSFELNY